MSEHRDLAAKLARVAQSEAALAVAPVRDATGTDTVTSVEGQLCALSTAGPNFRILGGLSVLVGDLVTFRRRERIVDGVLNRNALSSSGGGGGGMDNPMIATGDLIVGGSGGTPQRLAAGDEDQVLTVQSDGTLAWADPPAGGTVAADDVSFTPAGSIAATDAQAAIEEVATEAASALSGHTGDTSDAHAASAISIADAGNDFDATDVEGALAELQADAEAHAAASNPHPGYATDTDLSNHAAAADPHTGYFAESRLQVVRETGSTSISADNAVNVTVTWPVPFADTNYTAWAIAVLDDSVKPAMVMLRSKTTTQAVFRVHNQAASSKTISINAFAIHD